MQSTRPWQHTALAEFQSAEEDEAHHVSPSRCSISMPRTRLTCCCSYHNCNSPWLAMVSLRFSMVSLWPQRVPWSSDSFLSRTASTPRHRCMVGVYGSISGGSYTDTSFGFALAMVAPTTIQDNHFPGNHQWLGAPWPWTNLVTQVMLLNASCKAGGTGAKTRYVLGPSACRTPLFGESCSLGEWFWPL